MEHALPHPSPSGPGHPWRTIAVVATGVAAVELLVLAIVGIAVLGKPMAKRAAVHQAKAATVTKKPAAQTRPILSRGAVSVTVLNGNGVASRVRARG